MSARGKGNQVCGTKRPWATFAAYSLTDAGVVGDQTVQGKGRQPSGLGGGYVHGR